MERNITKCMCCKILMNNHIFLYNFFQFRKNIYYMYTNIQNCVLDECLKLQSLLVLGNKKQGKLSFQPTPVQITALNNTVLKAVEKLHLVPTINSEVGKTKQTNKLISIGQLKEFSKLLHNCTLFTCSQNNAQNFPNQASTVWKLRTSR